jgi:hypothetical protein
MKYFRSIAGGRGGLNPQDKNLGLCGSSGSGQLWAESLSQVCRRAVLILSFLVFLTIVYMALNTRWTFHFTEVANFLNYDMLANAFLNGSVELSEKVHPERLKFPDPADPGLPYPYLVDAVFFEGRQYFLQEPLPGLIHATWKLLTGLSLPSGAAIIAAALGCFVLIGSILCQIRNAFSFHSPDIILLLVWLSFGFSGSQLYIVSRPFVYNETIAAGAFFMLAAASLFVRIILYQKLSGFMLFLCGLFSGAAILCRLTFATYSLSFFLGLALLFIIQKYSLRKSFFRLLLFSIPIVSSVIVLMAYNQLRFGDALDFGRRHIMTVTVEAYKYCCLGDNFFSWVHIKSNMLTYFFGLPEVSFRHILPWLRFPATIFRGEVNRESIGCLFIVMPLLTAAFPLVLFRQFRPASSGYWVVLVTCWFASLISFATFIPFHTAQARYLYEFTPLAMIPIYYNFAIVWRYVENRPTLNNIILYCGILLFTLNAIMGVYLGLNGMVQWR